MFHEFTHAVNWDIADLGEKAYSKPFEEGVADFFGLSSRYDAATKERPIFAPGFNNNDLDPFITSTIGLATVLVATGSVVALLRRRREE